MTRRVLFVCLLATLAAGAAFAQPPASVSKAAVVTETATIVAIDATNRMISLKGEDGTVETIYAGPEVQRFKELKVGDKVTFKYYESVVFAIQQPGAKPPAEAPPSLVRGTGPRPGGTLSQQMTAVVTVTAIDMAVPSVSIKTEKGELMSFKVEDKSNLKGVKVGDKVQITYTQALAVSVGDAPKK
jgi:Cu/Ag efflux protein CusF